MNKYEYFPIVIIKKLLEFFQINSNYVKDFACEIFYRLSVNDNNLIQKAENLYHFIEYLLENLKDYTKSLNNVQIIMVYESLSNYISNVNDKNLKEEYFKKLLEKPNKSLREIINNKNNNINYLNNNNTVTAIRTIIEINERISQSFKKLYWTYGITIFKEIINIYIYYNEKLNEYVGNGYDQIQKENYKSINNTILKYFTSLVRNIDDENIVKKDMLIDYGLLLDKFSKSSDNNKNPNISLLFAAII